jgi:hypothetical protein
MYVGGVNFTSHRHTRVQHGLILFIIGRLSTALGVLMLLGARGPRGDLWPKNVA